MHLVSNLRICGAMPPFPHASYWRSAYLIKQRHNFTLTLPDITKGTMRFCYYYYYYYYYLKRNIYLFIVTKGFANYRADHYTLCS
jgi:hypothetical protein